MAPDDAKPSDPLPDAGADLPRVEISVNAICALNLAYFRKAAGLTQEELGDLIGWGKSMVSTAERSANESGRVRQFSASDLVSIARALKIPLAALFLPPEDHGIATTYVVTDAPYDEESEADALLPTLFPAYEPAPGSPAMRAYRERILTAGLTGNDFSVRAQEVADAAAEILARNRDSRERDSREAEDERYRQAVHQHHRALSNLREEREALNHQVLELRRFERDYRLRLQRFLQGQVRAIHAAGASIDLEAVLDAARPASGALAAEPVTALLLSDDGTYQVRQFRNSRAPSTGETQEAPHAVPYGGTGTNWGNLSAKETEGAETAMRKLLDRGLKGPYVILKEGGVLTVRSATGASAEVEVVEEDSGEGERLSAVLLPQPRDEAISRSEVP